MNVIDIGVIAKDVWGSKEGSSSSVPDKVKIQLIEQTFNNTTFAWITKKKRGKECKVSFQKS